MVQIPSPQPKNPLMLLRQRIFLLCADFNYSAIKGYETDERGSLGIESERILRMIQRGRRVVQRSKSEMWQHRVFGHRKRHVVITRRSCGSNPIPATKKSLDAFALGDFSFVH